MWVVVTLLVWKGTPYTGTSLNPGRSLGPAVVAGNLVDYWVYVVGPSLGALSVAIVVRVLPGWRPFTARLCHDPRYPSTLASALPSL